MFRLRLGRRRWRLTFVFSSPYSSGGATFTSAAAAASARCSSRQQRWWKPAACDSIRPPQWPIDWLIIGVWTLTEPHQLCPMIPGGRRPRYMSWQKGSQIHGKIHFKRWKQNSQITLAVTTESRGKKIVSQDKSRYFPENQKAKKKLIKPQVWCARHVWWLCSPAGKKEWETGAVSQSRIFLLRNI